jgi:hypothetical protein
MLILDTAILLPLFVFFATMALRCSAGVGLGLIYYYSLYCGYSSSICLPIIVNVALLATMENT